jgi:hypothetical protein
MIKGGIMEREELLYLADCSKCKRVFVKKGLLDDGCWTDDPEHIENCSKKDVVSVRCPKCNGEELIFPID